MALINVGRGAALFNRRGYARRDRKQGAMHSCCLFAPNRLHWAEWQFAFLSRRRQTRTALFSARRIWCSAQALHGWGKRLFIRRHSQIPADLCTAASAPFFNLIGCGIWLGRNQLHFVNSPLYVSSGRILWVSAADPFVPYLWSLG
jgi:hypothetical protein